MKLTIMAQNLSRGGLHSAQGEAQDRWPQLAERIKAVDPDLLLLSELNNWKDYGYKQYVRAANDLDLDIVPAAPSQTGFATGLMYNRKKLGRWQFHREPLATDTTHGYAVTGFDVGLPRLLNITPVHLCPYSADRAAQEVQFIVASAYKYSPFAIIGGDCNHFPAEGGSSGFKGARPYNLSSRTVIDPDTAEDSDLVPNRIVARTFMRARFTDSADYLAKQNKDDSLLRATTEEGERIDQFWISQAISPALESYELTNKNPEATDHFGVAIQIDTEKVDTDHMWEPEKL